MKKHYYLIVDTETTQKNTVADFGAVVVDRQGNIVEQFGVLLDGHFGSVELLHDTKAPSDSFWSVNARSVRLNWSIFGLHALRHNITQL